MDNVRLSMFAQRQSTGGHPNGVSAGYVGLDSLWFLTGTCSGFRLQFAAENRTLPKFEECLERLEQIVDQLEKGDIPLDQALGLFEEGIQLSNSCRKELEDAEGKVEILLNRNGKLQAEPFEAAPGTTENK